MVSVEPLLVFSDDWGRHPSSCQHLVRRLQGDRDIIWVNTIGTRQIKADGVTLRRGVEKIRNWARGLTQVNERMWVVDLPMVPGLKNRAMRSVNRFLVRARLRQVLSKLHVKRPIVLTTLPYVGWLIKDLPRAGIVYYCTDDYSHWPSADRDTLQRAEHELVVEADLVLAASHALQDRLQVLAKKSEYFPHGVDFMHFASVREHTATKTMANLPGPRIGFFGLIYEKLDFALLTAIAKRFPHGSLVMIGPVACCPNEFAALPNVHLLGAKPYSELPRALAGLDALILPYVDDPMIRQSGPLKLRECLATGIPTVSVDVPEVRKLEPHVRVATDNESFLALLAQALGGVDSHDKIYSRQATVEHDGWDHRAEVLRGHLDRLGQAQGIKSRRRKCRVLHLRTINGKGGGPEKTLLNKPRFLKDQYQVRLAYVRPEGDRSYDMPDRARSLGVDLTDIPERSGIDLRTLWRLFREVSSFRPDLLHAHDYKTNLFGVLIGRCFRIPVVTTLHGYVTRGGRLELYYLADRLSLPLMDHVVSVSNDLDQHAGETRVPRRRRSLIENAIDTEDFVRQHETATAKKTIGVAPERFLVGAVGRLAPEKGFDVLIRAVNILLQQGIDLELRIAGTGEVEPQLQSLVAELNLADRVRLLGHVSNPRQLFEAMDVFVLSSYREGLPNVLLEAMALEVPVVATRVNGVPRLVRDGENGVLVEPGSAESLACAIRSLLHDPEKRCLFASAGRRVVIDHFGFGARMAKVRSVYDSVLGLNGVKNRGEPLCAQGGM